MLTNGDNRYEKLAIERKMEEKEVEKLKLQAKL